MNTKAEDHAIENPANEGLWVDDRLVRMIGIPFFGLVIPSATGLMEGVSFTVQQQVLSYLFFIFLAGSVWEGNRFLLFRFYPIIYRSHSIGQKYLMMTGLNIFYTAPITLILIYLWQWLFEGIDLPVNVLLISVVTTVVCVIFVTNVYEKVLFNKQSDIDRLEREQLERARVQAELEALKNQIDPHFMFNTLNSISYLVEKDPSKAQLFIENLADVYRYILKSKDKELVLLREEMAFMQSYASLMKLRHEDAFSVRINFNRTDLSEYLIPPVSMMVAVENAVKHNEVSSSHKLLVDIEHSDDRIDIVNRVFAKRNARESTGMGLKNLDERFTKTLGQSISIIRDNGMFRLRLPILKLNK